MLSSQATLPPREMSTSCSDDNARSGGFWSAAVMLIGGASVQTFGEDLRKKINPPFLCQSVLLFKALASPDPQSLTEMFVTPWGALCLKPSSCCLVIDQ